MRKAILFDFDGVIADSKNFHKEGIKYAANQLGIQDCSIDENLHLSLVQVAENILKPLGRSSEIADFINLKKSLDVRFCEVAGIFQDTLNLIQEYKDRYRYCIVTGGRKEFVEPFLTKHKIIDYFEFIVDVNLYVHPKPNPEPYQRALELMDLQKSECIVIEDSQVGIDSAKSAGVFCIGINRNPNTEDLRSADIITTSLFDIDLESII